MQRFKAVPVVVTLLFGFIAAQELQARSSDDPTLGELDQYYKGVLGGVIHPANLSPDPTLPIQDYFQIDVDGFTRLENSEDFITAKAKFYGNMPFDAVRQRHDRPYYYINSWRSLFHPPIKHLVLPREKYIKEFTPLDIRQVDSEYFSTTFQKNLDTISNTELTYGNELELLPNGRAFREKLRMIREAKHYFFGTVMIYICQSSTSQLLDAMIEKKKQGVDVRIMVEGLYGSTVTAGCMKKMKDGGIDIIRTADFFKPAFLTAVNHNKFWIRDGEEAIIGGQNMHDYSNLSDGFNNYTRDTDVLIKRGPAVTDLLREYIYVWNKYRKSKNGSMDGYSDSVLLKEIEERAHGSRGAAFYDTWLSDRDRRMRGICRVMVQGAGARNHPMAPVIAEYMKAAQKHFAVSSPSVKVDVKPKKKFLWNNYFATILMEKASQPGFTADIISNGMDGGSGDLANFVRDLQGHMSPWLLAIFDQILDDLNWNANKGGAKSQRKVFRYLQQAQGIRTWNYFQFIHAKQHLFDRIATMVSSFNFDQHSTHLNHEAGILCLDARLRDQLEGQMTLDIINSVPTVSLNEDH